jgi:hypothetical protein
MVTVMLQDTCYGFYSDRTVVAFQVTLALLPFLRFRWSGHGNAPLLENPEAEVVFPEGVLGPA